MTFPGLLQRISEPEFLVRAARVRLVLADNDGVFTDNGVYYSERGEELKRYSIRDGMGVEQLRLAGIETGILTGEQSPNLARRAAKLQIQRLYLGAKDKRALLDGILRESGIAPECVAFIGDDVNDLGIVEAVSQQGLTATPADGMPVIREVAQYVCSLRGGHGAFREFADVLLAARAPR